MIIYLVKNKHLMTNQIHKHPQYSAYCDLKSNNKIASTCVTHNQHIKMKSEMAKPLTSTPYLCIYVYVCVAYV